MHSDIKPANFLVVEGQLKLIDFGIAKAIQSGVCLATVGGEGSGGPLSWPPCMYDWDAPASP